MHDDHTHCHCHGEAGHTHDHHEGQAAHSPEETRALLTYMIDHNHHHGEDLHEIYHALTGSGKAEAAQLVHGAIHLYEEGNEKLRLALEKLGGE